MTKKKTNNEVVIYQAKNGAIELKGDFTHETIWASHVEIADIFHVERSVITKHIRNILKDKELDEKSVCAKFAHTVFIAESDPKKKDQMTALVTRLLS